MKIVIKHFPLPSHKFASKASTAALAANKQGKFWDFHEKIFENFKTLNDAKIQEIARELKLDLRRFNRDLKNPAIKIMINKDISEGRQAGVRGTPTIFVNGKLLKQRNLQGFQQMIDAELKKKRG